MSRRRNKYTRALVVPPNTPPPRTEQEKRDSVPLRGGDIQMASAKVVHEMFNGEGKQPGVYDLVGVDMYIMGYDAKGFPLLNHVPIEAWRPHKVCDVCHLVLTSLYVQTYSGTNPFVDLIIGDTDNYKHYHQECEPTDGQYKFRVEYSAIERKMIGSDTGIIPKSKF